MRWRAGDLPAWYWTGDTDMACLRDAITQTLQHGYAHHIQRLMVTGLYALLLGVQPQQVHAWYLAVYVDAVEWVELPNTLGMSQYADGGLMASKPYIATGKYIERMSPHCRAAATTRRSAAATRLPLHHAVLGLPDAPRGALAANPRMALQVKNLARLAGRVHAEREHRAPIERVVAQRKAPVDVAPDRQHQQHRDPPGAGGPEEHREALDEGQQRDQEGRFGRVEDEQRARQGRDRHRPHIDPVGRRQVTRFQREEGVAVKDQRHHPDVEHAAPQPHRQRQEVQLQPHRLAQARRQQCAERGNRLRRHHRQQPGPVDALVQRRLVLLDRQAGEDGVGQRQPQQQRQPPQQQRQRHAVPQQQHLAAQDAGGRHAGEKARPAQMVDEVAEEALRVALGAQRVEHAQHRVGRQIEREERARQRRMTELQRGNRNDAGGHDHAEVGRRQLGQSGQGEGRGGPLHRLILARGGSRDQGRFGRRRLSAP
jgi:hypothetical protein